MLDLTSYGASTTDGASLRADDFRARLDAALGGAYQFERELAGGMSRVFVASEVALGRRVVLKVLPPEAPAAASGERFGQEIQLAARLQHPLVVQLLTAGVTNGIVYYTMPFVNGESLRGYLTTHGPLPLASVLSIVGDVLGALAYAHREGVVHCDIKPDNVLLSGGHALVTDFGVSRALGVVNDPGASPVVGATKRELGSSVFSTGSVYGTPSYMAPEQAAFGARVDHRADIYAVGVVAYELLTGATPTAEELSGSPERAMERLRRRRPEIPEEFVKLVGRCLAPDPGARPASAEAMRHVVRTIETRHERSVSGARTFWQRPARLTVVGVAVVGVAAAALVVKRDRETVTGRLDGNVIAVMPFKIDGADARLAYLREGMLDLLAAKLPGGPVPRAADARAVMSAWRQLAGAEEANPSRQTMLRIARGLHAGRLLIGRVDGGPGSVRLSAQLVGARTGSSVAHAEVAGPIDSLTELVDALTARVLAREAGETGTLASLTTRSLPALRLYLDAQASYREGRYTRAGEYFEDAIRIDTTFTLAALGSLRVSAWTGLADWHAANMLWRDRWRLSARDHALTFQYVGPRFPEPVTDAELLASAKELVRVAPDDPEALYQLGDVYFHFGQTLGVGDWDRRAAAAFTQAIALDSTFTPPLEHSMQLAMRVHDSAAMRRLERPYLARDSLDVLAGYLKWRSALQRGDTTTLQRLRAHMGDLTAESLRRIVAFGMQDVVGLDDVERADSALAVRHATDGERYVLELERHSLFLNRGRPLAAASRISAAAGLWPSLRIFTRTLAVFGALYADGDSASGAGAVGELSQFVRRAPHTGTDSALHHVAQCALAQWSLGSGETRTARIVARELQHAVHDVFSDAAGLQYGMQDANVGCAAALAATVAVREHRQEARQLVTTLDSLAREGVPGLGFSASEENLILARLWESLDEPRLALVAIRRRTYHHDIGSWFRSYAATSLREEGRLAAQLGDRSAAIEAYRKYLALRTGAEPALARDLARVRAELGELTRSQ